MPSPFTLTATEEEFKKMFPNLIFGPGENGVTSGSNEAPPSLPVVLKPTNRRTVPRKK